MDKAMRGDVKELEKMEQHFELETQRVREQLKMKNRIKISDKPLTRSKLANPHSNVPMSERLAKRNSIDLETTTLLLMLMMVLQGLFQLILL
ncbi:hypothetical protein MKY59_05170 [Paenibacillus sp. FSL W8-0426]|uniref:hypothetical protein n=1 Tax=Paenibacillus sp. FSL W8-0426 TaxID=2921714 RepID=UPI0030D954F1